MKHKNTKLNVRKGFSFVEVILSVFVLSVGLLAVMALMSSNLRVSMDSRNAITASGLAQEAVELVRNKMDNNIAQSLGQFTGLGVGNYCVSLNGGGAVGIVINCPNYTLNFSPNAPNIFYTNQGGLPGAQQTIFKRRVQLFASGSDMVARSYVWWGSGAQPATCNTANKCVYSETLLVAQ